MINALKYTYFDVSRFWILFRRNFKHRSFWYNELYNMVQEYIFKNYKLELYATAYTENFLRTLEWLGYLTISEDQIKIWIHD